MKDIIGKFEDGGPIFTVTILLLLLVIMTLFAIALIRKDYSKKSRSIIANFGWFALAWGYLGRTFGLIMAFDNVAAAGEIAPSHLAGGLKMALLGPLFGLVTFVIARVGILIIQFLSKKESFD